MTKKEEHTGFRNGDLFCFHCGQAQSLPLPIRLDLAAEFMKAFAKVHKKCAKTWEEPTNSLPEQKTEKENARWWMYNGEHGISSEIMFNVLARDIGLHISTWEKGYPHDPDDFRRCYLLLEAIPQWKSELHKLKSISPVWSSLVDNWETLTKMLEQAINSKSKKAQGMWELMQKLGC